MSVESAIAAAMTSQFLRGGAHRAPRRELGELLDGRGRQPLGNEPRGVVGMLDDRIHRDVVRRNFRAEEGEDPVELGEVKHWPFGCDPWDQRTNGRMCSFLGGRPGFPWGQWPTGVQMAEIGVCRGPRPWGEGSAAILRAGALASRMAEG